MAMSGGGSGGGIIGDGSLIEEVKAQESLLSPNHRNKFDVIYNKYEADEDCLSEADILFVLDCGKEVVRALNQ